MLPQLKATEGGKQSSSVSSSQLEREEQVDVRLAGVGLGLASAERPKCQQKSQRLRREGLRAESDMSEGDGLEKSGGLIFF